MRARLVPGLYRMHRGFFLVLTALTFFHAALALDCLLPNAVARHSGPLWADAKKVMGLRDFGIMHVILAGLLIAGLYHSHAMRLIRLSALLSVASFFALGLSFLAGRPPTGSFFPAAACMFVCIVAGAAVTEPAINPASIAGRSDGDGDSI